MLITYDPEADASYVRVADGAVVSTDSFTDLLAVDLDAAGVPVGLEVLRAPGAVISSDEAMVTDRYPALRDAFEALRQITRPA